MKRLSSLLLAVALMTVVSAQAQDDDNYLFTHLGGSLSVGTDGIGIDVATPITPYLSLRAGVSFFPRISYTKDDITYKRKVRWDNSGNPTSDASYPSIEREGTGSVEAKLNKIDGKILFDAYPFGLKNSFHVTAGLFMGTGDIVTASFTQDPKVPIGGGIVKTIDGDDWFVMPDPTTGQIDLRLKTNSIKPYLGIGFGRAIPKKRVNVAFDLGVQFHGTPKLEGYASANGQYQWTELEASNFDFGDSFKEDVEDALDIIHKVTIWPVLNIRVTGRFF